MDNDHFDFGGRVTYVAVDKMLTNRRIDELVEKECAHCEEKQHAVQKSSLHDFTGQLMTLVAVQSTDEIWAAHYREVCKYFEEIVKHTKIIKLLFTNKLGVGLRAMTDLKSDKTCRKSMMSDVVN